MTSIVFQKRISVYCCAFPFLSGEFPLNTVAIEYKEYGPSQISFCRINCLPYLSFLHDQWDHILELSIGVIQKILRLCISPHFCVFYHQPELLVVLLISLKLREILEVFFLHKPRRGRGNIVPEAPLYVHEQLLCVGHNRLYGRHLGLWNLKWVATWQNQQNQCAPSEDSVWSVSSLCIQWAAKDPSFLHANSKDTDRTGRTLILFVLSCRGSFALCLHWNLEWWMQ